MSFSLEGLQYNTIKIAMSHWDIIPIALCVTIFTKTRKSFRNMIYQTYQAMSGPLNWAQSIIPDLNIKATRFYPVMCINAWQRILTFDEHANMRKNHKFAVFFQKEGQTNEDEILSNRNGSKKFNEFMKYLGKKIKLADHKGLVFALCNFTDISFRLGWCWLVT